MSFYNQGTVVYASAHIDGVLDCTTLKVGQLQTYSQLVPVAKFYVIAGIQRHPIWAIERLASVVYCYCQAARMSQTGRLHSPDETVGIMINLCGSLVSSSEAICVVASSIHWHTSAQIRITAEAMIEELKIVGNKKLPTWPFKDAMRLPIQPNRQS